MIEAVASTQDANSYPQLSPTSDTDEGYVYYGARLAKTSLTLSLSLAPSHFRLRPAFSLCDVIAVDVARAANLIITQKLLHNAKIKVENYNKQKLIH